MLFKERFILKHKFLFIFALICLQVSSASIAEMVVPENFRLTGVKFVGVKNVSRKDLNKDLAARLPVRWKIWVPKPALKRADLDEDLVRIKQFYQHNGYYRTEAVYSVDVSKPAGPGVDSGRDKSKDGVLADVTVTYTVTEGPPVLIETIDIHVEKPVDGIDESNLENSLPIQIGKIFVVDTYNASKKELSNIYGNQGYAFAEATGKVIVDPEVNTGRIALQVDPGIQYRFGDIQIKDNDGYVKDVVIRRAIRFKPGELYNSNKIEQSQRNLYNLDVFKVSLVKTGKPESGSDRLPMEVQVKRKKRNSVKAGIGYGNEDGLRLSGAWTYRNLLNWGGKFSIDARRSDLIDLVKGRYVQSYFMGERNTFNSNAGFQQDKPDSYTSRSVFANAFLERKLTTHWRGKLGYNFDLSEITELKVTDPLDIADIQEGNNFLISSAQIGFFRDTTDNDTDPSRGSSFSLSGQLATSLLGSELTFFQPYVEYKKYYSMFPRWVLAGRIRYDTIQETEDTNIIPINKRIFLGGTNTVRGYSYQKLGPLDAAGTPLGGQSAINGNIELRYPIFDKISGVVFVDMGFVGVDPFTVNSDQLRFTSGAGLRYNTPVGPLRLDFGYKLNPPTLGDVAVTPVPNPDDDIEDRWKIHFSIGQAF